MCMYGVGSNIINVSTKGCSGARMSLQPLRGVEATCHYSLHNNDCPFVGIQAGNCESCNSAGYSVLPSRDI